ncbi:MAG: hypothetical protein LBJ36_01750 [Synergistaceae bacterium]|nr:hypothetical protein [Synergistaceae bacterium]
MIFDQNLKFINKGELMAFNGGAVGNTLDLGAPNQLGKGRNSYVVVTCGEDMTATGEPKMKLSLEFSENEMFSPSVLVPLSLPPLKKENFAKGKNVIALAPMYSLRFVRLVLETDIQLACSVITAGFVLDPQTNS